PRHEPAAAPVETGAPDASDRVSMMLGIFRRALTARQRWIYLAKNRSSLHSDEAARSSPSGAPDALEALMGELGDGPVHADLGWSGIAETLGINEKTAKREYLKSLHTILKECAGAVFGGD